MFIVNKVLQAIDRYYIVFMLTIAPIIMYFNWYAQGMSGLLSAYQHYKEIILNGFEHTSLITFPLWGYGWLMALTENKGALLGIQMTLAFLSLYYFIKLLEQESLCAPSVIRALKIVMIGSLPWYAFHALRWPYSISASLLLLSMVLLFKALESKQHSWLFLVGSGFLFGLLLNFRSDYWLMPLGFAFLLIAFFKTKKSALQALVWLFVLYSCLVPWALYTKKACGHYLLTSTNSGHVMFIGLGNDPTNKWTIEPSDGDPLMHRLVDTHFKKYKHSTLDYEADRYLQQTFFAYVKESPYDYLRKCLYACKLLLTTGFYPGEFCMLKNGPLEVTKNTRVRFTMIKALLTHDYDSLMRLGLHTISWLMGVYIVLMSYLFLPLTLYVTFFYNRSLLMLLIVAVIGYQTLLNSLCYHMPSYTSNLYIFYLLNLLYGASLAYDIVVRRCATRYYRRLKEC